MLPTSSRVLTVILASFALAAPAWAADPLLSGYSGPGGGEQTLLGAEEPPAPVGPKGGSSPPPPLAAVPKVGKAPVVIVDATPLTPRPVQQRQERPRSDRQRASDPPPAAARLATVSAVSYPATSADAWAFSLRDIVITLLLALLALITVALGTARLAARPESGRAPDAA
jgi:hypothetical protein